MHSETAGVTLEQVIPGICRIGPDRFSYQGDEGQPIDILIDTDGHSVHFCTALGVPRAAHDADLLYTLLRLNASRVDRGHFFALDERTQSILLCATVDLSALVQPGMTERATTRFTDAARDARHALGESITPN